MVTIVTPAYNRSKEIKNLFSSLCKQTRKDFVWLIIDDGSTDDTRTLIERYKADTTIGFSIEYIYKENGGKHTALNVAFREVKTELLFIVDSDDVLTSDAIATIYVDWEQIKDKGLCGIGYLRGYTENNVIGDNYPQDGEIDSFINVRYNRGVDGDKAEVWVTECLRDYQYPKGNGERFISESVAWIYLARKYDMLFRNKIIYITEYLEGGLTQQGRQLRFRCPENMAFGSLETMSRHFSFKMRIKQALLYIVYSKFGGKRFLQIIDCPYKGLVTCCYIPGLILYKYWKKKHNM